MIYANNMQILNMGFLLNSAYYMFEFFRETVYLYIHEIVFRSHDKKLTDLVSLK